ncbi:unnamed protein product [Linum trigynum]|uniref:Non-specific lipid-transfer protein n=1 Tax=Linum trigynum TaxID=586398 RepID=A0AAV2GHY9_9ROSI
MAVTKLQVLVALMAVAMVAASAQLGQAAVTCGQVASSIGPCVNYVRGMGPLTDGCCNGVKGLNSVASSTPDRQAACNCLKSLSGRIQGLKPALAAGLPGKCGVSIPYPISTSTDCTKVR